MQKPFGILLMKLYKHLLLFSIICICSFAANAQAMFAVSGTILDSSSKPIQGANVTVQGADIITSTNARGQYTIKLEQGYYKIYFAAIGYEGLYAEITLNKNIIRNMVLIPKVEQMQGVVIRGSKRDRANEVMHHVIDNKERWLTQVKSSTCQLYIRAVDETNMLKKNKKSKPQDIPDSLLKYLVDGNAINADTLAAAKKKKNNKVKEQPDKEGMNFTELIINRSFHQPNYIKEVKEAQHKIGDLDGLFYLSSIEGNFDFYQGSLFVKGLSDNTFITPLNDFAFVSYKFDLKGIYSVGDTKVYIIKITSRSLGNALMSGEIHVNESLWNIRKVSLTLTPNKLKEYDEFTINQEFGIEKDTFYMMKKQEFIYKIKIKRGAVNGRTVCYYNKYNLNVEFPKFFFGNELSYTKDGAYDKDTAFWDSARSEPLTATEIRLVHTSDSLKEAHSKKEYLDSLDSSYNKLTFLNILWYGQGHINRVKQQYWNFPSVVSLYTPIQIAGPRINAWISYYKKFKKKQTIGIAPNVTWGVRNQDWQGDFTVNTLYNPFKRGTLGLSMGRGFDLIYGNAAWVSRLRRNNFYLNNYINLDHEIELTNGLYLDMYVEYSQRRSVADYKYGTVISAILGDSSNAPVPFSSYNALTGQVKFTFVPFQKYMREPYEKVILGSRWPTFYAIWRKGIPNLFGSTVNYDYIELSMRQRINLGVFGISEYRLRGGQFLNQNLVKTIDYKYQRRGDPLFFTNPISTFQMLDTTIHTFNWFTEFHYLHRFNGFFSNKIPYFKKLNINEVAGTGFLLAPEAKVYYFEMIFGLERVFKIERYRFRLGVYYALGYTKDRQTGNWHKQNLNPSIPALQNTIFGKGVKISLEFFDRRRNQFSF